MGPETLAIVLKSEIKGAKCEEKGQKKYRGY